MREARISKNKNIEQEEVRILRIEKQSITFFASLLICGFKSQQQQVKLFFLPFSSV
jgi:hypothetical protein